MTTVATATCDKRNTRLWKAIYLLVSVLGLFVVVAGWSLLAGQNAQSAAAEVGQEVATHAAAQAEREKGVEARLDRLQRDLSDVSRKVDDLWRANGHGANR